MGTDISMYAERYRDNRWQLWGPLEPIPEYDRDDSETALVEKPRELYGTRNYSLFAILADVRNPRSTSERYDIIASPRGLPVDLSPELSAWANSLTYARNHSWLTLKEILDFDWLGHTNKRHAMVDPRAAHLFRSDRGFPLSGWPPGIQISYAAGMAGGVQVRWTETYAEVGAGFLDGPIRKLANKTADSRLVRIVFWFS